MAAQYVVPGAIVVVLLAVIVLRRGHVWRRTPRRFWTIPVVTAIGIIVATPASELESPSDVGLVILGGLLGLGIGGLSGTARFTSVGRDPDGRIAHRPNVIGFIALVVVFALHHLANLAANDDTNLQFILTILLTLGVGETSGWHGMVFWRWCHLARTGVADSRASTGTSAQP